MHIHGNADVPILTTLSVCEHRHDDWRGCLLCLSLQFYLEEERKQLKRLEATVADINTAFADRGDVTENTFHVSDGFGGYS